LEIVGDGKHQHQLGDDGLESRGGDDRAKPSKKTPRQ
jgi:hypothetical protein